MLCSNCFQRTCRLHPLFDHGKRALEIKEKVKSLNSNITSLIQQQISKLEADKVGTSDDDLTKYKEEMEILRSTKQGNEDSNNKKRKSSHINSNGLNPTALSVMLANDDESNDDNSNNVKSYTSSSSSSSGSSSARKKKSKKVQNILR